MLQNLKHYFEKSKAKRDVFEAFYGYILENDTKKVAVNM